MAKIIAIAALMLAAGPLRALAGTLTPPDLGSVNLEAVRAVTLPEELPAPVPAEAGVLSSRFPTSSHSAFAKLDSEYREDNTYGDYYPFAGYTDGPSDENGNSGRVPGLLAGMADESGHFSLLSNGGDPRHYWESALKKFRNREFPDAYHDIGIMCHLTQDQAVPAHAANINHVVTFGDKFESFAGKNLSMLAKVTGNIEALLLPSMQPYEYYQALQDDTRRHLAAWVDPGTGFPYWPPAPGGPRLGEDATKGSRGDYHNDKDTYDKNVSPEILERQMRMAAVYTKEALKAAARLLPPAFGRTESLRREKDLKSPVDVSFNVYDNRRGVLKITIERPLYGQTERGLLRLSTDGSTVPSGSFKTTFSTISPIKGKKDIISITVEDADGNISRNSAETVYEDPDANFMAG